MLRRIYPMVGLVFIAATVLWPLASNAQRQPVLGQIDLPHPYYFRELYLPQLTQGPSSLTWSPDSKEIIYSMAGTLWRQRLDSTEAVQLTDNTGLDYQPDWSPDGKRVIYSSYRNDAIELWLLDIDSGRTTQLTHNNAVNLEPRWSPNGRQIVFVSTQATKHFHLFTATLVGDSLSSVTALTKDKKSPLRRYYYSAYDHEINPTWSRDGKEILYVSNQGHIHGTGGFWRIAAKAGAVPREIHYEETNWRARPEVSPDNSMVLYSSYLGRNTHQLWLMPAQGGDALPLTYGDFDATGARFSPDGKSIAYLSNEQGDFELRLIHFPGHDSQPILTTRKHTLRPTAELHVHVVDSEGQPLAARLSITDDRGQPATAQHAWTHADDSYDRHKSSHEIHYFHTAGNSDVTVPAGGITVSASRGLDAPVVQRQIQLSASQHADLTLTLNPRAFVTDQGTAWVSGDAHVHMNYAGNYRNTPQRLAQQARSEGLSIVNALVVNKEQRIPDIAYSSEVGNIHEPDVLVVHGQEFHTSYWGHLGLLHPEGGLLLPGYVGYPNTAAASLVPTNADVADMAHAEGAVVGYVHPFDELPEPIAKPVERLTNELPIDVALGKVDYMEILGFSDHRSTAAIWYRLLNLGFRIPAAAGTDAMADYASLRGPVGLNRVYVQVPKGPLDINRWLEGLRAGRTFATNGPLLSFELEGQGPGSQLNRSGSVTTLQFKARLSSIVPVDRLEVVCDGQVVASLLKGTASKEATIEGPVTRTKSGWCLLRADSNDSAYPVLDTYTYATTSPVYLNLNGTGPRSKDDAAFFLAWIDRVRQTTSQHPDWRNMAEKQRVLGQIDQARREFVKLQ